MLIRRNANLSTGGTAIDVTERVHPAVAACAVDAAKIVGLDVAGIDVVAQDISRPLTEQGGVIVEVNAAPGLRMHLEPSVGISRPVGEAIVDMLFPAGENGPHPYRRRHGRQRQNDHHAASLPTFSAARASAWA